MAAERVVGALRYTRRTATSIDTPMTDIVLYRNPLSGHAHRVELFLALLKLPVRLVDLDLRAGAHKAPEFLRKNPFGQVPVIEDGDVTLADSNAILVYLAGRYDKSGTWYPREPLAAARVQQWLSVAAGQLAAGPATARLIKLFGRALDHPRAVWMADQLFAVMDQALASQAFLTGATPTIADVAMYTYTAHAPEGGVMLEPHANIRAWLARVEALPGFVPMQRSGAA
jgi:glutathione S-transferase